VDHNPDRLAGALEHARVRACECCGDTGVTLHRHHIIPRSSGGRDSRDNIAYLCYECHRDIHRNPENRSRIPHIPHDSRFDEYNAWGQEGEDAALRQRSFSGYRVARMLRILELQYEGFAHSQIASELGVSRTQVQQDCRSIEQLLKSTESSDADPGRRRRSPQAVPTVAENPVLRSNRNQQVALRRQAVAEILGRKPDASPWFVLGELGDRGFHVSIATVRNDIRLRAPA